MKKETKQKIMDKKWENMEKEGMSRPTNAEENQKRARDAHVPESAR